MLIGDNDITNDVITLNACFSMFVYIHFLMRDITFHITTELAAIFQRSRTYMMMAVVV